MRTPGRGTVRSPRGYLRWPSRGWNDILEPFYTMIWLLASASCLPGQALGCRPQRQLPGHQTLGAPQTSEGGVCGKRLPLGSRPAERCISGINANSHPHSDGNNRSLNSHFSFISMLKKKVRNVHICTTFG